MDTLTGFELMLTGLRILSEFPCTLLVEATSCTQARKWRHWCDPSGYM